MNTGERIRNLRESHGLSQEGLGKILGVDRTTIVKWETGASRPTRSLKRLAHYFNVTTDYILGTEDIKAKHTVAAALPVVGNIIKMFAALSPQKQEQAASYIAFLAQDDKKA